jgi:glycogen synthase
MTNISNNANNGILKVAHITMEYKLGVGGIKAVTTGLLPALSECGDIDPAVITPFFDVYNEFYKDHNVKLVATVTHIYKGKQFKSDVFRVCTDVVNNKPIYHYLIKPIMNSPVAYIFNIGEEKNMYQAFKHSEPQNRIEYFNSAAAALLRMPNDMIPEFDIIHEHTWLTGLTGCLAKEFENLPLYQDIIKAAGRPLKKIPHVISTVHMLLKGQNGTLMPETSVQSLLGSVGLPQNFTSLFPNHSEDINKDHLKQIAIAMLYSDHVTTVSKGLAAEVISGKAEGLDGMFKELHYNKRLQGITNGINIKEWDATDPANLQQFVFNSGSISADKQRIKNYLTKTYPNLDPNKKWFIFIGRFADEKGVEYLPDLLHSVLKANGNLIILGSHVAYTEKDGQMIPTYKDAIDSLKVPGCVVIDNHGEQKKFGKLFRAASDCGVSLSKNEACGLVPMELMMYGLISVVPKIQGLPDTVNNGTGILYNGNPKTRAQQLEAAILAAAKFLDLKTKDGSMDLVLKNLINTAAQYDWTANPAHEYSKLYKKVAQRELLTAEKIKKQHKVQGRIWAIGFNKCGTTTIFEFFNKNGIPSMHHGKKGHLATSIYQNHLDGKMLLSDEYSKYKAFFDIENIYADPPIYITQTLFKELDKNYPGSKFILNTRDKSDWIKSRRSHVDPTNNKRYVDVLCESYGINEAELIARWSKEWDAHHAAVTEYFKDRPQDLLVFDIDNDSPEKICEFFKDMIALDPSLYGHHNKTPAFEVPRFSPA